MVPKLHRLVFAVVLSSLVLWSERPAVGQEAEVAESSAEGTIKLGIGDKAPKLQVDHWQNGEAVESFSKDNVYVIEFWATWCVPCIKAMPHLNELAEQYSKDGLIVVATTQLDESNTQEAVEKFIGGAGSQYRFRFALCESDATYRAYMEAAAQRGIPCSFVIDREGKVAYIGHPHDLDYVLDRVMTGKWRGKADVDELREMNESIGKLGQMAQTDPDKALQIVEHIRRVNPQRTKSVDFAYVEVMVLCQKKMFDQAKSNIESLSENTAKSIEWGSVAMLSGVLASKEMNPDGVHRDYAAGKIKAAEEALKDDWQSLVQVGIAYKLCGEHEKYKTCMSRVIELCPDEQVKKALQLAISIEGQAAGQ